MYGNQLNIPSADWTTVCILDKRIRWVLGRRTSLGLKPMARKGDQQHTLAVESGSWLPPPSHSSSSFPSSPSLSTASPRGYKKWIWNFPCHINSWDGSITELNENIRDKGFFSLSKVKILSIRKAAKVNSLVKLHKLLKSQTTVK